MEAVAEGGDLHSGSLLSFTSDQVVLQGDKGISIVSRAKIRIAHGLFFAGRAALLARGQPFDLPYGESAASGALQIRLTPEAMTCARSASHPAGSACSTSISTARSRGAIRDL